MIAIKFRTIRHTTRILSITSNGKVADLSQAKHLGVGGFDYDETWECRDYYVEADSFKLDHSPLTGQYISVDPTVVKWTAGTAAAPLSL